MCGRGSNQTSANRACRKRKLVDRTVPGTVLSDPTFSVDSKLYTDLREMERKLDWTMMRKKAEIQDAMGRVASVRAASKHTHIHAHVRHLDFSHLTHFCLAYRF